MSTHHMSKKLKPNDDTSRVLFEYTGEAVPDNVTHVRFHPSVVDVTTRHFEALTELREVILNEGLREIGGNAFRWCISLQRINIPSTVTKIGRFAFSCCSSLIELVLNEGLREIGESAFHNFKALQRITIPSTVTKISYSAFRSCYQLRDVVLNNGLKEIGQNAFQGCSSIQSVTIPSSVKEIDHSAFRDCTNLREVVLSNGLKKIGDFSFEGCTSLQSISIPSTVDEIASHAFEGCTTLRNVVLNDGIKRIKEYAFEECTSLECITIPLTASEISNFAFRGCGSLQKMILHDERMQISFLGCPSLERFKFPSLSTRLGNIIQAWQRDIEAKIDSIPAVEWRDGELFIPAIRRERLLPWGMGTLVEVDEEKLIKVERLIAYYEIKEATTLFELAIWKARINQAGDSNPVYREACRIDVPGPVKETILKYLL